MTQPKFRYLPEANCPTHQTQAPPPVKGDSPCPCCGCITIPNGGDALAYICPVCLWEIDLFLTGENEPSDQNHGLTLAQARQKLCPMRRRASPAEAILPPALSRRNCTHNARKESENDTI